MIASFQLVFICYTNVFTSFILVPRTQLCDRCHTNLDDGLVCATCGPCCRPNLLLQLPIKKPIEGLAAGVFYIMLVYVHVCVYIEVFNYNVCVHNVYDCVCMSPT